MAAYYPSLHQLAAIRPRRLDHCLVVGAGRAGEIVVSRGRRALLGSPRNVVIGRSAPW